jgi:enterochelin esterase-like enzyme
MFMTDSTRYLKRTIVKETIASKAMNSHRRLLIYLPPGYNELLSYPALYCQDGEDFFNFGRIATQANRLILDEGLEPLIIIGVEVDKARRTAEYDPEGSGFAAYTRFFSEELMPAMESRFPLRPDAGQRVLAGDSLGGTVSLHLALDYPQRFRHVIALSGAFGPATWQRIQREPQLNGLNLYMLIGLDEQAVATDRGVFDFLRGNRETYRLLQERGASIRYVEKPGRHLWGFWQAELPEALLHFFHARTGSI